MKKKILFVILGILVIGIGLFILFRERKEEDNIKFSKEYSSVSTQNVFVYKTADEIIKIMEHGTGVVYLGFPECPWCNQYVKYLNEVAIDEGIDKIYYYNILNDRKNNTDNYQKMVSLLGDNLQYDEEGNPRIYVPNVSFHINGEVIGNDYETSFDTHGLDNPKDYWTDEEVKELKGNLSIYMKKVFKALNSCTDCNK